MLSLVTYLIVFVLIILMVRAYKHPGIAAALVWSMIVLESVIQQGNSFLVQNSQVINFAVGGTAAAAALMAVLNKKYRRIPIPTQMWLYGFLMGFCLLSVIWSVSPEWTVARRGIALPYIIAFGFLAPMCIFDEKQLAIAIKATIYFGALVVLADVLSNHGRRGIILSYDGAKALESNPLAAASYAGYVGIASLFSIWGKKLFSPSSMIKSGIILICLMAMIKSGSRGQLIAFSLVSTIWLPIMTKATSRKSIAISVVAFFAAVLLSIAAVYLVDQLGLTNRWDFKRLANDNSGRIQSGLHMLQLNLEAGPMYWIFGLGTSSSFKFLGTYPHNIYLETIAEEGLIGTILLWSIIVVSLRQGYRMMQSDQLSKDGRLNNAILIAILSFNLILAAKQGSLIGSSSSVFCLALTIGWSNARNEQRRGRRSLSVQQKMFHQRNRPRHHPGAQS